ncbi:50S ribosome-binding GTPase [Demequina sp. B12]|uniref:GTPase n=1 Tax=Demequina sp. B12 TaxID=2992757 RepID=UPI00237C12E2|nr:GTPase [Demequina sp. B12]MDE0573535.1 50S ribosome-binding GTPase [Demequina sp. B12]
MSVQFVPLEPRSETVLLGERVARLRSAMEWASDAIPAAVRAEVFATIDRCEERLALGVDHTVVALAGGTGSGKSTLFNAILGREFAVPGVARPTTSHVSAAVWGGDAVQLLDWLGISQVRRFERVIDELDDDDEINLAGMVLLDLPDHDSVNADNRATVDRIVPMADLLLWVVDPQKYADHALHSAYLEAASRQQRPSLVVLNHVDRLSTEDAWAVARDLQRLLAVDGMTQVPVMPISARTGQGLDILRAELGGAVAARSVAAEAVRSDLVHAGRLLSGALSRGAEPQLPDAEELVEALARAAGVDARAEAAGARAKGAANDLHAPLRLTVATAERERMDWVDAATDGLPPTWRQVMAEAVSDGATLSADLEVALADAPWPVVARPTGLKALFARAGLAASARKKTLDVGRAAVRAVVVPDVVEPTVTIHQAYRAMDELTRLDSVDVDDHEEQA